MLELGQVTGGQVTGGSAAREVSGARSRQAVRLVLVDDDPEFRESLALHLIDEGFAVTAVADGQTALQYLGSNDSADIVLLDWRMPVMNGLAVLHAIRERGITTPVIFFTGVTDDACEEVALSDGAVDFVNKSRRLSVLVKRIEMIVAGKRPQGEVAAAPAEAPEQLRRGALELRFDTSRAYWRGKLVDLTLTEFKMVSKLAARPGVDASYRELYDLVHGKGFAAGAGTNGFHTNVRTFVKRIRNKFRAIDIEFDRIHNYARFGYRWRLE